MEHIYRLEESWLDNMQESDSMDPIEATEDDAPDIITSAAERRGYEDTRLEEIIQGLVIGFFFALIPFFFFSRPQQPIFWDWDWKIDGSQQPPIPGDLEAGGGSSVPEEPIVGASSTATGASTQSNGLRGRVQPQPTSSSIHDRIANAQRIALADSIGFRPFKNNIVFTTSVFLNLFIC